MSPKQEATYYLVPNLRALDTSAREVDLNSYAWVQPIVIDDEDLMFGGKSLSAWYEEDRRRLSSGSDDGRAEQSQDEERRGRERAYEAEVLRGQVETTELMAWPGANMPQLHMLKPGLAEFYMIASPHHRIKTIDFLYPLKPTMNTRQQTLMALAQETSNFV